MVRLLLMLLLQPRVRKSEVEDGSDERTITTAGTPSTNGGAATPTANPSKVMVVQEHRPEVLLMSPLTAGTPIPADDDEPPPDTRNSPAPATETFFLLPC
ncbi:hypothetical protein Plhal703r1_c77g0173221 [Plasmopara halstedii]